ncbi:SusC/RagA family TonB-linked outer membrane protein [uncultured Phocaeicola sp.]|uniref:SusC/RagA family TonB-linked outer membrane protein n=1 Tax=uncultured Phocaeicola sp. TaxID=990718 RepID=UPI0025F7A346|nr:SusC/RagA family TonB-linked outer membrane protein [uncultured Phocaeicola sp.]
MKLKKSSYYCLSQATPPLKNWLHSNKLRYLVLAASVFPMLGTQLYATTDNSLNQTTQSAQTNKVTYHGTVIDENGDPLPGVNITYKNAKGVGVITDVDGNFTLAVPTNVHSLIFSYVGMKTQTVRISSPSEKVKVRMEPDALAIQETVITGIYTRKAESFTGSMATYSEKELKTVGNQNVLQSLKVLDPSFIVLENNLSGSDPNATMNLNIGGNTNIVGLETEYTTNPNQPLFILDGFETTLSTITDLSMDRVASITILKDAASTAIYGAKAANGVVVVETKKPEAGRLQFNYNGNFGLEWADLTDYNLMNSSEKLQYEKLAGYYGSLDANGNIIDEYYQNLYNQRMLRTKQGIDSYWMNEPLQTGFTQSHNIFAEGGDAAFRYGIGMTYTQTQGVMKNSNRDVLNGNVQLTYRIDKFAFTNQTNITNTDVENPTVSFSDFARTNPFYDKYNEYGEIDQVIEEIQTISGGTQYITNPLWDLNQKSYDKNNQLSFTNNFQIEYRPLPELRIRGKLGIIVGRSNSKQFDSPEMSKYLNTDQLKRGSYSESNTKSSSYDGSLDISYGKTFGKHTINAIGGMQISENNSNLSMFQAIGYSSDLFSNPNFANGYPEGGRPSSSISKSRTASYYANFNYGYQLRYLLDFNLRTDGSSVYGVNNPFSTTWSLGLGWNIHNEEFFNKNGVLNYLKLRYSVGNPGNANLSAKMANSIYTYYTQYPNMFGLAALISSWGNSGLKWQRTNEHNVGVDIEMFHNRLRLSTDFFIKKTDPLLLSIDFPPSTGISQVPMNIGAMKNIGTTFTGSYIIIRKPDMNWTVNANLRHIRTTYYNIGDLLEKYNEKGRTNQTLTRYYDGASNTALYAVRSAGIDPMTGNEIFIRKDGSYTFKWDSADEVICGDSTPDVEGAFGTSFYWKGFSVNAIFSYRYGGQAFLSTLFNKVENISDVQVKYNQDKRALYDRWQKPGDIAKFKRIDDTSTTNMSSRFIADDNTLELSTVSVGYETTAGKWLQSIGASSFNVRIYGNNLFRLSTIKEERGIDYPFSRSISASVGIRF